MQQLFSIGMPGGSEWLIILAIFLLLFGASRLPKLMRSMGSGVGEFKKGLEEGETSDGEDSSEETSEESESTAEKGSGGE